MTLDEAIKELTDMLSKQQGTGLTRRIDAIKLGIEALRREQADRPAPPSVAFSPLDGETEE